MLTYTDFEANLNAVRKRIERACDAAERSVESVHVLPVTKNHPEAAVAYAARAGLKAVGENRVQEAAAKRQQSTACVQWELIGHLQSNKVKDVVGLFDRIQSVDSLKLLEAD